MYEDILGNDSSTTLCFRPLSTTLGALKIFESLFAFLNGDYLFFVIQDEIENLITLRFQGHPNLTNFFCIKEKVNSEQLQILYKKISL